MGNKFTEEDKKDVINFLNMVANHARFEMDTKQLISYFKLLSKMQQEILPKIEDNILEVKSISDGEESKG